MSRPNLRLVTNVDDPQARDAVADVLRGAEPWIQVRIYIDLIDQPVPVVVDAWNWTAASIWLAGEDFQAMAHRVQAVTLQNLEARS